MSGKGLIGQVLVWIDEARSEKATEAQQHEKWRLAATVATDLYGRMDLPGHERATAAWAACHSFRCLGEYNNALEPGQIAWYLALESADAELLGRSLLELGFLQSRIRGQEWAAMDTYRRYFEHEDKYSDAVKKNGASAMFNLACVERMCRQHEAALSHFREAWERGKRYRIPPADVEEYARNYCWQSLLVGDLKLAKALIDDGYRYQKLYPQDISAKTHLLLDEAWYHFLQNDYGRAISYAMRGVVIADEADDAELMTRALLVWSWSLERLGDLENAVRIAMWANQEAQETQRPERIEEVRLTIESVRVLNREVVDGIMTDILQPSKQGE